MRIDRRSDKALEYRRLYHTARWRRVRAMQLSAYPLCAMCLPATTAAKVCDHVTPHKGDAEAFYSGPFQSLCELHHNATKQSQEHGKLMHQVGADGWPIDK